jgi:hypothetical protein
MYDMKAKRLAIWAFLVVFSGTICLHAQEDPEKVFAPYPSRIRVGVKGRDVVISWVDSPDVTSGYAVYRHRSFPELNNFQDALFLGFAENGEAGFTYTPEDEKPYFYCVLGRIPEAERTGPEAEYRLFIPLRNVSMDAVSIVPQDTSAPPPAPAPAVKPAKEKLLSGILVRVDKDAISVSIDASDDIGRLIVYRGTSPITTTSMLLDAALAAIVEQGSGPYKDYPVPGIDYYYAIIPERDLAGGQVSLVPGVNSTVEPVSIAAGAYRVGLPSVSASSRSMPLPYLVLTRGFQDAKPVGAEDITPEARTLSAETEKAIANFDRSYGSKIRLTRPQITIFPEDLHSSGGGEEYALKSIVGNYLAKGDYAEAARQFNLYLSLPRSPANAVRARFYKGQAMAMAGSYREAFFDMLQAQDAYYLEASAWIDFILDELRRN